MSDTTMWKPIQTAPRDGTTILVYFRQYGARTVRSCKNDDDPKDELRLWWVDDYKYGPYPLRGYRRGDATHWMPLPEPPNELEGKTQP